MHVDPEWIKCRLQGVKSVQGLEIDKQCVLQDKNRKNNKNKLALKFVQCWNLLSNRWPSIAHLYPTLALAAPLRMTAHLGSLDWASMQWQPHKPFFILIYVCKPQLLCYWGLNLWRIVLISWWSHCTILFSPTHMLTRYWYCCRLNGCHCGDSPENTKCIKMYAVVCMLSVARCRLICSVN